MGAGPGASVGGAGIPTLDQFYSASQPAPTPALDAVSEKPHVDAERFSKEAPKSEDDKNRNYIDPEKLDRPPIEIELDLGD